MKDGNLYELIYQSNSSSELSIEELKQLLDDAVTNNDKRQITGCLIYHNRMFFQVLEGEKQNVLQLLENIKRDPRNKNLEVIFEGVIGQRGFKTWCMSFIHSDEMTNIQKKGYTNFLISDFTNEEVNEFKTMSKEILLSLKKEMF